MTIVKSKLFQPTEKYLLNPSAVILTIASRINDSEVANDAISALTNLGINRSDAQNSISAILTENPEISISELIKEALKTRARK